MDEAAQDRPSAQFSMYLPADLADAIDEIAKRRGTSRAQVLREFAMYGVERERRLQTLDMAV